jgi:hypothetical protein
MATYGMTLGIIPVSMAIIPVGMWGITITAITPVLV